MLVVVNLNVAVETIPLPIQPPVCFGIQLANDLAKDTRQPVFSAKREDRGNRAGVIRFNDIEGLPHESTYWLTDIYRSQG